MTHSFLNELRQYNTSSKGSSSNYESGSIGLQPTDVYYEKDPIKYLLIITEKMTNIHYGTLTNVKETKDLILYTVKQNIELKCEVPGSGF